MGCNYANLANMGIMQISINIYCKYKNLPNTIKLNVYCGKSNFFKQLTN